MPRPRIQLRPTANLLARLKPDRVTKTPEETVLNDRLTIVERLREMARDTWPNYSDRDPNNPVADMLMSFAARLEREIRQIG